MAATYPRRMTHVETVHVLDTGTAPAPAVVVCGIDGSPEASEAARQAALLVPPDARMELVGVDSARRPGRGDARKRSCPPRCGAARSRSEVS